MDETGDTAHNRAMPPDVTLDDLLANAERLDLAHQELHLEEPEVQLAVIPPHRAGL